MLTAVSHAAHAQDGEQVVMKQIEEMRQHGINLPPEEVQRIITNVREAKQRHVEIEQEVDVSMRDMMQQSDLQKPLSHVIGKDGVPFPNPEDVVFAPVPTSTPSALGTPTPEPIWSPEPYKPPRKCEVNQIERQIVYDDEDDTEVFLDILFLPQNLVPLDPEEAFGPKVSLEPYTPVIDSSTLREMELVGVPCVPYRIRRTLQAEYHLYGTHALRRYEGVPTGKESMHPVIQEKLSAGR
jgi:hypothetical protein